MMLVVLLSLASVQVTLSHNDSNVELSPDDYLPSDGMTNLINMGTWQFDDYFEFEWYKTSSVYTDDGEVYNLINVLEMLYSMNPDDWAYKIEDNNLTSLGGHAGDIHIFEHPSYLAIPLVPTENMTPLETGMLKYLKIFLDLLP